MRVADGTAVLILEILRIRLDVENVTGGRVRRAGGVWAGNRLQMGQSWVQLRVLIQGGTRLCARVCEGGLEHQGLVCRLRIQLAVVATVPAQEGDLLALGVLLQKEII